MSPSIQNQRCLVQWLLIGFLLAYTSACQPAGTSFEAAAGRAKELYDKGQFRESRELFGQVIQQSGPTGALLYNLGCANYRDGQLGLAVAAWRSALLLLPRDPDLAHNLEVASKQQVDRLPEIEQSFFQKFLQQSVDKLSLDEWSWIVYGFYCLFVFWIGIRLFLKNTRHLEIWATTQFLMGLLFLGSLFCLFRTWSEFYRPHAVVIAQEVQLFSGPDASGEKVATLHAGLLLEVTGAAGQDVQVRLATGWQGFLPQTAVKRIGLESWSEPR